MWMIHHNLGRLLDHGGDLYSTETIFSFMIIHPTLFFFGGPGLLSVNLRTIHSILIYIKVLFVFKDCDIW